MKYSIKDFMPLITIFIVICAFTIARHFMRGYWCPVSSMRDFMGAFFIVFGAFKLLNVQGFVKAYQQYDLIAKHSSAYAYCYPFIELGLGVAYLANWHPILTNSITLVIMLISAAGVFVELRKGKEIMCACLGVVFTLPMTYVTLLEDLVMAAMAASMLVLLQ